MPVTEFPAHDGARMVLPTDDGRGKGWIQTFTGHKFWPMDARVEDVHIEDIAHGLANLCRFAGQVATFYSVGEHSWRVCDLLEKRGAPPMLVLAGLLHDATEAYMVDVPRPVKHIPEMQGYRDAEDSLGAVIYDAFGVPWTTPPKSVKMADEIMLVTEARDLFRYGPDPDWSKWWKATPQPGRIRPMSPEQIEPLFLAKFHRLREQVRDGAA